MKNQSSIKRLIAMQQKRTKREYKQLRKLCPATLMDKTLVQRTYTHKHKTEKERIIQKEVVCQ